MSTLAVNTITNAAGGNTAQINGMTPTADSLQGFRNRIINGNMVIDQRNAGASVTVSTSGVYVIDRWKNRANGGGAFSVQQSSTAPAGFTNSSLYTVTTADSSIAAGDNYWIIQEIEGYNVADLDFGTANAKNITMSFWVRSSVTGTYSVFLSNGTTYNRGYVATYTINAADTWEQKSVTVAGDTTGTWGKTNGGGLSAGFNLGAGTNYQTTAGSWGSAFVQATSGTTQWISNSGATFYITGVQLEAGSVATPFERRPYGTELALCQRYYYRAKATKEDYGFGVAFIESGTLSGLLIPFPVPMRTIPSALEQSGTAGDYRVRAAGTTRTCSNVPTISASITTEYLGGVAATVASGQTAGWAGYMRSNNSNAFLGWSAEL
jgi:hypothetical protein